MSKKKNPIQHDPALLALIKSAQNGDQIAFEELLARYTPLISSMTQRCAQGVLSKFELEDMRQEAVFSFFKALKHFDTAQQNVDFGLYAKHCIRNCLVSHWRKQKRREPLYLVEDEEIFELAEDTESNPVAHVVEEESYEALSRLIHSSLSEYENRIWWMYLSGRTAREIAESLKKDEKSVQNAIYRIRRKLREIIPYQS